MNSEFVAKIRQRSRRDLLHSARMGWLLYPCGAFLGYLSGLSALNSLLFWGVVALFSVLLVLRFWYYWRSGGEPLRLHAFVARISTGSAVWGMLNAYAVVHAHQLIFYEVMYFGSLLLIGVGGLLMYVPVFPVFLAYVGSYTVAFSVTLLVCGGLDHYAVVLANLLVVTAVALAGRRQYMMHSRALVSSLLLERRARELETAYSKLETASTHRMQFMQSLTAELHAALDGINRVSEFLKQTPLGDGQMRLVETARRTTRDLVQYLEGISEISALESGKAEFFQDQIYLPRTLGGLLEELAQQALLGGRSFVYRLQPGLPEVVLSDRHRLQQLVRIMVENCMRLTDAGGTIRLHAEWKETTAADDTGILHMRFTDNGVGMDIMQVRSLIEDAYMATNDADSPLRGVCMHFALLGRILFRMHGHFHVESLGDVGNAYEITIPLTVLSWRNAAGDVLEAHFDSLGLDEDDLPRILLVDDNVLHQRLLDKLCVAWGYALEIATTGAQALQWIELRHFDLLLVDVLMPVLDCHETLSSIRRHAAGHHYILPIVGLSNDSHGEGQRAAMAVGVDAFVPKPFAPDTLYQVLNEQLIGKNKTHV